jgi:general secretion pathway protein D
MRVCTSERYRSSKYQMAQFRWLLLALPLMAWGATSASQLFSQGQVAEKAGDIERAYSLYSQASATKPNNKTYRAKVESLRPIVGIMQTSKMLLAGTGSSDGPEPAATADSEFEGVLTDRDLDAARRPLPPVQVAALKELKDFDIHGDGKALVEQVVKAYGLTVVFDQAYQPSKDTRLQITGADFRNAMHALEAATGTFFVPVSTKALFAANDTTAKRTEFDRDAAIVLPIPDPLTVQEVQEILTAVRGTLDITRMVVDSGRRLVLIRDRASKLRVAQQLFHDLSRPRAQVNIEVEVIVTDVSSSLQYGLDLPTEFSMVSLGHVAANLVQVINPASYLTFGGGRTLFGLSVTSGTLFGLLSKSNSTTLLQSQMLAMDGQAASLHVGDKYPIATNLYLGNTSGSGQVYTPPPTFSFEDLGLSLKATPHVHGKDEVSMDLTVEFKLLGAAAYNGIPVIESTKYESKVRVREGEWAVLSGLTSVSEMRNITGFPGLTSIPMLHNRTVSKDKGDTLIILKPHLVKLPPTELPTDLYWVGTDSRPRTI